MPPRLPNVGLKNSAFQVLPFPVLCLDAEFRVLEMNQEGELFLQSLSRAGKDASGGQSALTLLPWLAAERGEWPPPADWSPEAETHALPWKGGTRWFRARYAAANEAMGAVLVVALLPAPSPADVVPSQVAAALIPAPGPAAVGLGQREEWFRTLLEHLPQRIFLKDSRGVFVGVNESFARDFGLPRTEVVGRSDFDLFQPELAEKYRSDDLQVMASGALATIVERNEVQGTARVVEVVKVPVFGEGGEALGILGVFNDITERQRIQEELAHERDLLHKLMDNVPDCIYFKDLESRFTRVNQAQAQKLGFTDPAQVIGKSDLDCYPAEVAQRFLEDEQEILRSGEPLINKVDQQGMPGELCRWSLSTKVPTFDQSGQITGLIGISHDITNRIRAEDELRRTADELARSNDELQQFAYVASHDLQEPLRMVASYTQLLARRYRGKLDQDAEEFIGFAVDGATRMQGLIHDLLAYSRVGTRGREYEATNLAVVLGRAQNNLQASIQESGAVITSGRLPMVTADPVQLLQLFQNLVGNAVKFRGSEPPRVEVSAAAAGEEWVISVSDNGIGIDPAYAERIFIIFQRLHGKMEYGGSGIGLAICKKIVQQHGGRIWVDSRAGEGATFRFTLPRHETASHALTSEAKEREINHSE